MNPIPIAPYAPATKPGKTIVSAPNKHVYPAFAINPTSPKSESVYLQPTTFGANFFAKSKESLTFI